jgi:hypothetical protein
LRTAAATEGFELMPSDLPDPEIAWKRVRGLLARRGIGAVTHGPESEPEPALAASETRAGTDGCDGETGSG